MRQQGTESDKRVEVTSVDDARSRGGAIAIGNLS